MKSILILFVSIGLMVGLCASVTSADTVTATPKHICHGNQNYCVVPGTGTITNGEVLWTKNTGNWYYLAKSQGSVNNTTFKNAQVGQFYNGQPIYLIEFNSNHSYCVGANTVTGTSLNIASVTPCSGSSGVLWVYDSSNQLINIYLTNKSNGGRGNIVQAMTGDTANAASITTTQVNTGDPGRQVWQFTN